jgi:hypothetical protein
VKGDGDRILIKCVGVWMVVEWIYPVNYGLIYDVT